MPARAIASQTDGSHAKISLVDSDVITALMAVKPVAATATIDATGVSRPRTRNTPAPSPMDGSAIASRCG